ncbi:hypothetical protein AGMMS49944_10600 [Spirochaetia bacterium]|nr:hypothetical protein AGMMS49944_10600 [Spirochaetia bacterium]
MATTGTHKIYSHNEKWETVLEAARSLPKKVGSYQELVERVGTIALRNNGCFLFYRGQDTDHQTKGKKNTQSKIIASIYRPSRGGKPGQKTLPKELKDRRIYALTEAKAEFLGIVAQESAFSKDYKKSRFLHYDELSRSIFQHYGTLPTPLLDVTQSLPVACSIPTHQGKTGKVIIYVLGFEDLMPTVTYSYRQGFELLHLVGVMPEFAKRPLFQEGSLVSNFPPSIVFSENEKYNFASFLLAKFEFDPKLFWTKEFRPMPEKLLFPKDDRLEELLRPLKKKYADLW